MFGSKNKPQKGFRIRREHLFAGDEYLCSVCGAKLGKKARNCPKCKAVMTKTKADPRWIDKAETFDIIFG